MGTSQAGSVASALKFYAKQRFAVGAGNPAPTKTDCQDLAQGIGARELFESAILAGLPGMTENVIREQLTPFGLPRIPRPSPMDRREQPARHIPWPLRNGRVGGLVGGLDHPPG